MESLLGLQPDVAFLHGYYRSGETDVRELSKPYQLDKGHKLVVLQLGRTPVHLGLQGVELDDNLFVLAWLQDSFLLVGVEALRQLQGPFGGLLSQIADDHWLLSAELDRTSPKIEHIWEVDHSPFPHCVDGNDELLPLSYDDEFVFVIDFGLW